MCRLGQGVGLGLRPARVLAGFLFGCDTDLERLRIGGRDLLRENLLGLGDQLGRSLLGLGDEVAGRVVRGLKNLGRFDAKCPRECRLVDLRVVRSSFRFGDAPAQNRFALQRAAQLGGHLAEERSHGLAVKAPARWGKGLACDLVRTERRT